ncbi:hypothetical protein DHEL01_v206051 [Diaporthe helianthi]|uniref:Uncharacterized protein n=1 Tax=Diaporthe helianthi TaxID=158607 RepID=A0A2P5HZ70_DIAHE|nr:hypothetical protein DHEL01_v206051 [Diaporthe helianthi]
MPPPTPRDPPRGPRAGPRPRPMGKWVQKEKPQNSKYVHGVTVIDRSKGTPVPEKRGQEQITAISLLAGEMKCRLCYEDYPRCKPICPEPRYVSDVNVYWTESSGYRNLPITTVRKSEDIAMAEAKRLGMSCVVLRSDHHNTAAEFTRTGKFTGRYVAADWHITLYLGDDIERLLLQGHVYTFVGANKEFPRCKLAEGNRTILESHEVWANLTIEEAAPDTYWGINGSLGWVNLKGEPVHADGSPVVVETAPSKL